MLFIICFSSCESVVDHIVFCTDEAIAGLNVIFKDAKTNEFLIDGVVVMAQEDEYTEILTKIEGINSFFGAWERMGNYTITITKEGYQTFTSSIISVESDICHVIPKIINVSLIPID